MAAGYPTLPPSYEATANEGEKFPQNFLGFFSFLQDKMN
jgi:hypothetical protein